MAQFFQFLGDPWFIAMLITLAFMGVLTLYALRNYVKDVLILALALPRAAFRKIFGPPRR